MHPGTTVPSEERRLRLVEKPFCLYWFYTIPSRDTALNHLVLTSLSLVLFKYGSVKSALLDRDEPLQCFRMVLCNNYCAAVSVRSVMRSNRRVQKARTATVS
ncbi:hypothetical protein PHSY_006815 [Pseudozyma hubeiensis SY62]|uniref:Uncharacterized protein n=1 Tax=Pseudozyma hubeiensis (strain SY62) TaxID=1305764 RepID=R9PM66_PSEHS|nr:hypothetical protein PHSY_006815 [Pseudozyma hubeiensis SY62]GAC99215.1 hypothetical protein PHSY_006815 [Pseudozyma hubeiensis SY62]